MTCDPKDTAVILAAGLTPAWQQVLMLDSMTPGAVNRARAVSWCASGKVLNCARALHHLGGPCMALSPVGGTVGQALCRDFARLGIAARWVDTGTPTRVCTTILESARHTATELVPAAGSLTDEELAAFLEAYSQEAAGAAVVGLIGSLPVGTPTGFYRDLLVRTPAKVILDARGPELLEALAGGPFLIKPNREELAHTLGRKLAGEAELVGAMQEMNQRGAEWVVVTDGSRPIHASGQGQVYRIGPLMREVVNPIGCGDCLAAGIAWATFHGQEPLEAIRYGVAAAADKVGRPLPGEVDAGQVAELARCIVITRA
jgi:1-phosphofructokinase family hexose kinase